MNEEPRPGDNVRASGGMARDSLWTSLHVMVDPGCCDDDIAWALRDFAAKIAGQGRYVLGHTGRLTNREGLPVGYWSAGAPGDDGA